MLVPMGSLARAWACPDRKFGLPMTLRFQLTSGLAGRTAASLSPNGCLLWAGSGPIWNAVAMTAARTMPLKTSGGWSALNFYDVFG